MRRWGVHLMVVCGAVAAAWAAGLVWPLVMDDRTNTITWGCVALSRALLALAGFLLVVPLVWQGQRSRRRFRPHWGLLAAYGAVGVILAVAYPLAWLAYMYGASAVGQWLTQLAPAPFLSAFGAVLAGAGSAHALADRPGAE